jgi:hypothetical protein
MPKKDVRKMQESALKEKLKIFFVISKERMKSFFEIHPLKKFLIILISFSFALFFLFVIAHLIFEKPPEKVLTCSDGTFYETCSLKKPYFCSYGILIEKASVCGCSESLEKKGELCISKYQNNPKNITLEYILRGEKDEINYTVYGGVIDYLFSLSRHIFYSEEENVFRRDFKLKNINEEIQREMLLPLVIKIQNLAMDKEDQARIAISLIQNIPYEASEEIFMFEYGQANQTNSSGYPYDVFYNMNGSCEEKSNLLAFLLKEIGYGVAIFYYPIENHEVVGIKCPVEYSLNSTGYCFVETTGPSIISDNGGYYLGWGKLSSEPEVMLISEGDSLGEDLYEYEDAKDWVKINGILEEKGKINIFRHWKLEKLREKYGLIH